MRVYIMFALNCVTVLCPHADEGFDDDRPDIESWNCVKEEQGERSLLLQPSKNVFMNEPILIEKFDPREHAPWTKCWEMLREVPHQGRCGDCWAHATALTVSQRICINSIDPTDPEKNATTDSLSVRFISTCGTKKSIFGNGCNGSNIDGIITAIKLGILTGSTARSRKTGCQPYLLPSCQKGDADHPGCKEAVKRKTVLPAGDCSLKCDNKTEDDTLRAVGWGGSAPGGIRAIQEELKRGPMITKVFAKDKKRMFRDYEGGVLQVPKKLYEFEKTDHFLILIGYNTEVNPPYWIITNTWGEKWGEGGFARLLLGNNTLHIEKNAFYLFPPPRVAVPGVQTHFHHHKSRHPQICQSLHGGRVCQGDLSIFGYDMKDLLFGCIDHFHPEYSYYKFNPSEAFRGNYSNIIRRRVRVPVTCY